MPRLDFFAGLHPGVDPYDVDVGSERDPLLDAYRSGFWAVARIAPGPRMHELRLRARLQDGQVAEALLAQLPEEGAAAASSPPPSRAAGPQVAICMATYNPAPELFRAQIESIRAQTHRDWICLISDDRSEDERFAVIAREVEGDERFVGLALLAPSRLLQQLRARARHGP